MSLIDGFSRSYNDSTNLTTPVRHLETDIEGGVDKFALFDERSFLDSAWRLGCFALLRKAILLQRYPAPVLYDMRMKL